MRSLRTSSRRLALFRLIPALCWLVTQLAMAGLAASPARADGAQDNLRASLSQPLSALTEVVICTPEGPRLVTLADNPHPPGHDYDPCRWCQGFGQAVLPAPDLTYANAPGLSGGADTPLPAALWQAAAPQQVYLSRAPPLLTL